MTFSSVLHLWTADFSPHPARNPFHLVGIDGEGLTSPYPIPVLFITPQVLGRGGCELLWSQMHGHSLLTSQLSCTCSSDLPLFFGLVLLLGIVVSSILVSFTLLSSCFLVLVFGGWVIGSPPCTLIILTLSLYQCCSQERTQKALKWFTLRQLKCWVPVLLKN